MQLHNAKLLGIDLLTDYEPLAAMLKLRLNGHPLDGKAMDDKFPGLTNAVITSMRKLESRRLRPNLVTYLNFRIQVWSLNFDADPTPSVRIIPKGVLTDINGPVTFIS